MDEDGDLFDVWSDEKSPFARMVVVQKGGSVPSIFISDALVKIGSSRVADDIRDEVQSKGFCAMRSNVPYDTRGILGVSF